jgi:hypothetical protein
MMALLAGSYLAMNTLRLTEGSTLRLSEIFPKVEHIKRFDQRASKAQHELRQAEPHLAAIAVPYALSLHEAFVISCAEMLRRFGTAVSGPLNAKAMHQTVFRAVGVSPPQASMEAFQLLRVMRNSHIHLGGDPSTEFPDALSSLSSNAVKRWITVTGRAPGDILVDGRVLFVIGDVFLAFSVTNALGQDLNRALQQALLPDHWGEVIAEDYWGSEHRGGGVVEWNALKRFATTYYSIALPEDVLWRASQKVKPGRLNALGSLQAQQRNFVAARATRRSGR